MGKKSKRSNKKNNGGPLRTGLAAAVPTATAAPATTICETICLLFGARELDEILKLELKYRHLETFSTDPAEDVHVLHAIGHANYASPKDETRMNRAVHYFERAKERIDANAHDLYLRDSLRYRTDIGMCLADLYSNGRDMEKAISSYRWSFANGNRPHEVKDHHIITISRNFNRFKKCEYTIEVLEGSMDLIRRTFDEWAQSQVETYLIQAYTKFGEFLKAKATNKKRLSKDRNNWIAVMQSGEIEEGLCNYKAAIAHFRKGVVELQKQGHDGDSLSRTRVIIMDLATALLKYSAANEAEAFAIFQDELDRCVDPRRKEKILFQMGTCYRKLNKWDQSIEALRQLFLSSTRPHGGPILLQANKAMAQTYLEQYCTDTTLDIDHRTQILRHAIDHSNQVDEVSTEMHLTQAQLFYFNGDKQQAYRHLKLYLNARLAECKLSCYSCKQRVRHGSVPFSCASCMVASYCGRKHQKLTWKNERICHKVLCPLLGHWRMAKKKKKKHNGLTDEDRRKYEAVFDTFFESICPYNIRHAQPTEPR